MEGVAYLKLEMFCWLLNTVYPELLIEWGRDGERRVGQEEGGNRLESRGRPGEAIPLRKE